MVIIFSYRIGSSSHLQSEVGVASVASKITGMSFWKPGTIKSDGNGNQQSQAANSQHAKSSTSGRTNTESDGKTTLSKGVMTMKFMKRKADADQEAVNFAEKRRKQLDSAWTSDASSHAVTELDHLVCTREDQDLISTLPGRRSFGGFNKAVERNYEQMIDEKRFDKASERASKNSVSDAEMLARYENLIGLPRGPSQGMRPKKEKINKPKDGKVAGRNSANGRK